MMKKLDVKTGVCRVIREEEKQEVRRAIRCGACQVTAASGHMLCRDTGGQASEVMPY